MTHAACSSLLLLLRRVGRVAPAPTRPPRLKGHDGLVYSSPSAPTARRWPPPASTTSSSSGTSPPARRSARSTGHTGPVYCVAFSKDGTILASSSHDKTIRLWNPADGKLLREIKGHTDIVDSIAFSPDGKLLASGSARQERAAVEPGRRQGGQEPRRPRQLGLRVAFSPDGKLLASRRGRHGRQALGRAPARRS